MAEAYRTYIPAAGHDWPLSFYDPLVKLLGGNSARMALVKQAGLAARERVLEVGSGIDRGVSDALPYANGSFDCVFSCFMFHHLKDVKEKQQTLREIRRVLEPGGRLALLDFAPPDSTQSGLLSRWTHSSHLLKDNTESRMLSLIGSVGFTDGRIVRRSKLAGVFHTAYYQAVAPKEETHA